MSITDSADIEFEQTQGVSEGHYSAYRNGYPEASRKLFGFIALYHVADFEGL